MLPSTDSRHERGTPRLLHITEERTAALVDEELALEAVRAAFASTVDRTVFPSLAVHGSDPSNRFTLKPSASATHAGVKIGTYWPGNTEHGLPRHHSTLLFDQTIGRIAAVLEVGTANAYRTAAADALAAELLARPTPPPWPSSAPVTRRLRGPGREPGPCHR